MKATDAAWLAGILDGEGYIDVPLHRIEVKNCDRKLLKQVQRVAGCGAVYTSGNPRRKNHRRAYKFSVGAKTDVRRILKSVESRLITKRAKCRLVLRALS